MGDNLIITLLLQTYNELSSGHLERFISWNHELFDNSVALDDQSNDGTRELLTQEFDLVLDTKCRSFKSELFNKQYLLDQAKLNFPKTDWFIWLDADELLLTSRLELDSLISSAQRDGFDSISLPLTNLWKSEKFYRVDSHFDSLVNVRLWKNSDSLHYAPKPGLHQSLHPLGLKRCLSEKRFTVLHFGFSSFDLIVDKFANYRELGQRGNSLWRLVDESNLEVQGVETRFDKFGARAAEFYDRLDQDLTVMKNTFYDYFWAARLIEKRKLPPKTKITLISLIYSGVDWLEFQYGELLKLSSELPPGEVEILFVANNASPSVIEFLDDNGIPYVVSPGRESENEWYINSVYRSYNFGVSQAKGEYVLLTNSDMAYCEGFLYSMMLEGSPDLYLTGKLIESGRLRPADAAIKKNFGKKLKRFQREAFEKSARRLRKRGLEDRGLFMPALLHKDTFLKYGGYPEGNLVVESLDDYLNDRQIKFAEIGQKCIPGDKAFLSLLTKFDIEHKTNLNSLCYHFQEGEKSEFDKKAESRIPSGFAVANDRLIGINNEKTLWNYLIEDLEALRFRVQKFALGTGGRLPYRFVQPRLYANPRARVLFRNATFLRQIRGSWRQIVLVQDLVLNKKLRKDQRLARIKSAAEITNSEYFLNDLGLASSNHKYLLPLPIEPSWEIRNDLIKRNPAERRRAIFIGAFNQTKGWGEIRPLVQKFSNVNFCLVSKYSDDISGLASEVGENWEIKRNLNTLQLISEVDNSDFLIIGSPFETQCLVAIECASRGIPVLMKETGLLSTIPEHDRNLIGIFNNNLEDGLDLMLEKLENNESSFSARNVILKYGLDSPALRQNWVDILTSELQLSFIPITAETLFMRLKKVTPKSFKIFLKSLIGLFVSKPIR